jgi:hypothetical protein
MEANKVEPFSIGIGVSIGIFLSSLQSLIHYMTDTEDVTFLGMAFLNGVISIILMITILLLMNKRRSDERRDLLKVPDKVKK